MSETAQASRPDATAVARRITDGLLRQLPEILADCDGAAVFVYADALPDTPLDLPQELAHKVLYVTRTDAEDREKDARGTRHVRVPNVALTRLGQIKVAVVSALARGWIRRGDVIVCLTGMAASGTLDTVMVMEVGREFETFVAPSEAMPPGIRPEVVERIIQLATDLGVEGREGKSVGALFVVGDTERVRSMSRQLILNPFRGYAEKERNILDPRLGETVKELAAVDGAFLVRGDGVVESAGTFLKTSSEESPALPRGLGARHHAAAGITAVCGSIAVAVSESTGMVTIFRDGGIVTSIDRPRRIDRLRD